jgi:hypothetical protein
MAGDKNDSNGDVAAGPARQYIASDGNLGGMVVTAIELVVHQSIIFRQVSLLRLCQILANGANVAVATPEHSVPAAVTWTLSTQLLCPLECHRTARDAQGWSELSSSPQCWEFSYQLLLKSSKPPVPPLCTTDKFIEYRFICLP